MNASDRGNKCCFIDTNLWLYTFILNQSPDKTAKAKALIQAGDPVISTQVINEVCVNLIKKAHFPEDKIQQLISSFYHRCLVVELTREILMQASELRQHYFLSYWDSTILASALHAGVPILYSEDMQHNLLVKDKLRIVNPFAGNQTDSPPRTAPRE